MHEGKKNLLMNRLKSRLKSHNLNSYEDYYRLIKDKNIRSDEVQDFIDAVTTNETYFFRCDRVWDFFQNKFLPEWYENHKLGSLNIWCAATSSGEEPYTIALSCKEFEEKNPNFRWTFEGSDISLEMLDRCKEGKYKGRSLDKVPKPLLKKYFDEVQDGYFQVSSDLRKKMRFFQHKLQDSPPKKKYDIVFIRNVLIYFDVPTKKKVLEAIYSVLRPGGIVILGEAENTIAGHLPLARVAYASFQKTEEE